MGWKNTWVVPSNSASVIFGAAVLITGCAVDRFSPEAPMLPAAYQGTSPIAQSNLDTSVFAAFGSAELDDLIITAERNSPDLAAAVARVRQADARARQAGAAILPEVDANGSATQFSGGSHGVVAHETDWSALLSASYELDFWGKNRAARNSAQAMAKANRADLDTARTTILTAVASTFFQIQSFRERITLAAMQAAVLTLAGTGYSLTAGADVVQAIFDNGRRRAVTQEAAAHEEELLASYRGAILSALSDVENALAEIQYLDLQKQAQQQNVAQSERAFDGSQLRYREGSAEYLAVLESQRILYAAREQLSHYRLARLQALLGLSKALGGGWQSPQGAPVARASAP